MDVYVVKTDSAGDTLWTRTYGGDNTDGAKCVHQTSDSGYIFVGYTHLFGAGSCDVFTIKINEYGDITWARTYGNTRFDYGYLVEQTSDGGYIIVGCTDL